MAKLGMLEEALASHQQLMADLVPRQRLQAVCDLSDRLGLDLARLRETMATMVGREDLEDATRELEATRSALARAQKRMERMVAAEEERRSELAAAAAEVGRANRRMQSMVEREELDAAQHRVADLERRLQARTRPTISLSHTHTYTHAPLVVAGVWLARVRRDHKEWRGGLGRGRELGVGASGSWGARCECVAFLSSVLSHLPLAGGVCQGVAV